MVSILCVFFLDDVQFLDEGDIRTAVGAEPPLVCLHDIFEGIFIFSYGRRIFLHHFTATKNAVAA